MILNKINISSEKEDFWYYINKMYQNGVFLLLYILTILGIYSYSIQHVYSYILNNEITDSWGFYAKIIGCIMIIITFFINNITTTIFKSTTSDYTIEPSQSYGICITHILALFVYFQFIISMYYQTDGFTL
jgi:hypothetical protein